MFMPETVTPNKAMFIEKYCAIDSEKISFTRQQGSDFAKQVADDFNPLHNIEAKRFCVPGDLLFSVIIAKAGLYKEMSFDFSGMVNIDAKNNALIINGTTVKIISANAPEDIDYTSYGIDKALVIDNTGAFRDKEALSRHLKAKGASKVLLTAPGKGIPNIVYGVNHREHNPDKVDIFYNDGSGSFGTPEAVITSTSSNSLVLIRDADGKYKKDLLVLDQDDSLVRNLVHDGTNYVE